MSENWKRWRGLKSLLIDAVEHGSRAVERVQKETAARPFAILEDLPDVGAPAKIVHAVHDVAVTGVHGAIRVVNKLVGATADVAFDVLEKSENSEKTQKTQKTQKTEKHEREK